MSSRGTAAEAMLPDDTLEQVQRLVQVNVDSAEGFREAADAIDDRSLATDFRVWAADRTRQAEELSALVMLNGEEPPQDPTWAATLHQTWLNLRSALSSGDAYAVLAEVERGEDQIKEKYEEVLKTTAGSAVHDLLQQHYACVKVLHDRIRDLRDARKRKPK